jgi:hypothetical protein
MPIITKELALRIVKKLGAQINERPNRPHDLASVFEGDKLVATFGIRHGSNKDQGHDHIPDKLYIRPREARLLGQCPLSRAEWVNIVTKKGLI